METADEESSDGEKEMDIDTVRRIETPTITLNLSHQSKKETKSNNLSDGNEGMEVDDARKVESSKDKVIADADVDVKAGDKPKINETRSATIKRRPGDKNRSGLQKGFSESSTGTQLQNECEKKDPEPFPKENFTCC